jgi:PAS domain S-box-containing protein
MMDTDCRIQRCNRAAQTTYGDQIIGRYCWEVVSCAREQLRACPISDMCRSGGRTSTEVLVDTRWLNCTLDPLVGKDGKICGALHVLWDITSRKHAENSLQAANADLERRVAERTLELGRAHHSLHHAERRLRRLIEQAPTAIAMLDRKMNYLAVSQRWLNDYGLESGDCMGRSHYEVFPGCSDGWKTAHRRTLAGEILRPTEDQLVRADGSVQWLRWEFRPWLDDQEAVGGVIVFTEDITDHRRAEETLQESEEKFRRLFATISDAIFVFEAETRRFVEANAAALRLYGYTHEELQERTAMDLTAEPEASAASIAEIKAGAVNRIPLRLHKKKDGTVFPVEICASAFVLRGKTLYCGIVRDISERQRTEGLLQKANGTLRAIRDCHEAMIRAGSEQELLNEVCRIIVQRGGERMAWVGFAESNSHKSVRPMAAAGVSSEHLKNARLTWANGPRGRGPSGTAIRTGRPALCRNTQTDPGYAVWRKAAKHHGWGSVLALPLTADGRCFGALAIYAQEADGFDEGEQLIFTDLANDLAFGINTLRLRAERARLEHEILISIEREQERIGRELHDGLCQLLVGAKFRSVYLQNLSPAKRAVVAREAKSLETLLNLAIQQARDLARGLNPVEVTSGGLAAALHKLAADVESAHGVHCSCQAAATVKISCQHAAHHLYRIAQEAVQNALKHAGAKNISISLARTQDHLMLTVKDDGEGLPQRRKKTGMGLENMQIRAKLIGGGLEIRRRRHGGTEVACALPINPKNKHAAFPPRNDSPTQTSDFSGGRPSDHP